MYSRCKRPASRAWCESRRIPLHYAHLPTRPYYIPTAVAHLIHGVPTANNTFFVCYFRNNLRSRKCKKKTCDKYIIQKITLNFIYSCSWRKRAESSCSWTCNFLDKNNSSQKIKISLSYERHSELWRQENSSTRLFENKTICNTSSSKFNYNVITSVWNSI